MDSDFTQECLDLQEICRFETVIDKIKNGIQLYHCGVWPAEILAIKMGEYSDKLKREVLHG